jgi:16S rRNA (guanine966-N2)-methyltransferase
MRIVAGRWRGRTIAAPTGRQVRPTADRVREAWMSIVGPLLPEARVLDLFAGSGALGIEAVSRGASYCLFVEDAAEARALIRQNVEAFGLTGETRIFRRDATDLGPRPGSAGPAFDLAFLDPPYGKGLGEIALGKLAAGGWLAPGATVIFERGVSEAVFNVEGFDPLDARDYGAARVHFLRFAP